MKSKSLLAALLASLLLLAACGSDSGGDTSTDVTNEAPADSDADSDSDTDSDSDAGDGEDAAAASCTDGLLFADGRLTVATGEVVYGPWMSDDDPANQAGYEAAFVYELADRLGFDADHIDWVRTTFDEAITPADKDYDFNIQQYSITDEREEVVDFSAPYYVAQRTVMAVEGSPADGATTFADLADVKWAATAGTFDLTYIEEVIGADDVAVFNTQADTIASMIAGQTDATVVNLPTAYYLTAVEIDTAVIAGVLPDDGEGADQLGLLLTDANPLVDCLNPVIEEMRADGTLDALAAEWLQGGGEIPNITQ